MPWVVARFSSVGISCAPLAASISKTLSSASSSCHSFISSQLSALPSQLIGSFFRSQFMPCLFSLELSLLLKVWPLVFLVLLLPPFYSCRAGRLL